MHCHLLEKWVNWWLSLVCCARTYFLLLPLAFLFDAQEKKKKFSEFWWLASLLIHHNTTTNNIVQIKILPHIYTIYVFFFIQLYVRPPPSVPLLRHITLMFLWSTYTNIYCPYVSQNFHQCHLFAVCLYMSRQRVTAVYMWQWKADGIFSYIVNTCTCVVVVVHLSSSVPAVIIKYKIEQHNKQNIKERCYHHIIPLRNILHCICTYICIYYICNTEVYTNKLQRTTQYTYYPTTLIHHLRRMYEWWRRNESEE